MASWVRTITSPFRKACTFFNHNHHHHRDTKKSQQGGQERRVMDLHGEVMACAYEDVQVMWSILDKSKHSTCNLN
ncbi:uncharacterized protein LOC105160060 [Sesamum indicum]|uniref:Uncharacterized protein LOC105160060 n=1 Tax=Sesamum indicum TaxID=4182 RepID=A0A8M8UPI0_SESIN|nr:uncharacterized protein LOC105160060 [Sesamum indicum]